MKLCSLFFLVIYASAIIPNTFGCHWARRRRNKRQSDEDVSAVWRLYFAECMSSMLFDPSLDWTTNIDYTVFDSIWYIDVDTIGCTSLTGSHTAECWKDLLALYIDEISPILTIARTCIDRFVADSSQDPPILQFQSSRKKRGAFFEPDSTPATLNRTRLAFTNCLTDNIVLPEGRTPLRYDLLSNFIEQHTITKYSLCGQAVNTQQPFNPSWTYRFQILTRTDSPIRKAVAKCNNNIFPAPNFWGPWSPFSPCSGQCGSGVQVRTRSCRSGIDENVELSATECPGGNGIDRQSCQLPCPDFWGDWGSYGACSVTCDTGIQRRSRVCNSGGFNLGGLPRPQCPGSSSSSRACVIRECPNVWTEWGNWGACSCDSEVQLERRYRECRSPSGQNLPASSCDGSASENRQCIMQCAPPKPWVSWGPWQQWSDCTASCGGGRRNRMRYCFYMGQTDSPISRDLCECALESNAEESESCNRFSCQSYQWTQWIEFDCSVSCGRGSRTRRRTCRDNNNEVSAFNCGEGEGVSIVACRLEECESEVNWSIWARWSSCRCQNGNGVRTRVRCNLSNCSQQRDRETGRCFVPNCLRSIQPQSLTLGQ